MSGWIWNVQISCAGGPAYEREAGALAALYGELLGMRRYDPGYTKLTKGEGCLPEIGFESDDSGREVRPRWPDPGYPQQMHLDIVVGDLDAGEAAAVRLGATRLRDAGDCRVFADSVGHPFCLYRGDSAGAPLPGRVWRIVLDCFSPRALASFYEEVLDMPRRVVDTPELVVLAGEPRARRVTDDAGRTFDVPADPLAPMLAFQHAQFLAARWPDPAYPPQMHLDLGFDDRDASVAAMQRLGAIRLSDSVYADPASHPHCT